MTEPLRRTPLHAAHLASGAKMVPFGGWDMPVQYSGIVDEHQTVRQAVGLFDVSHMGEIAFRGPGALAAVQRLITNDVTSLADGRAIYSVMCHDDGGIVDDCIVYRTSDTDLLMVTNASNATKDLEWIRAHVGAQCTIEDRAEETGLIAVQGPRAVELVSLLAKRPLAAEIPTFHFRELDLGGAPVLACRTGYTGEDGFELACRTQDTFALWGALLEAGAPLDVKPAGLGARDTLRLEARLSLYGNDIDATTTPWEAGLGWVVKPDAGDFIGRSALLAQKAAGVPRKLIGFYVDGRGIARHGYPLCDAAGVPLGHVTSGTMGPTVGRAIGMGYVPTAQAAAQASGQARLTVDCRGKQVPIELHTGPFYKRPKTSSEKRSDG